MTDKEKLDAIRAEIHRLVDVRGYDREMAYDLFVFMDSLPNEPVSVWHDMSEEAENGRNIIIIDPKNFYGAVLRKGGSQLKNHNKGRYVKWAYIDDIINITN